MIGPLKGRRREERSPAGADYGKAKRSQSEKLLRDFYKQQVEGDKELENGTWGWKGASFA